MEIIYRPPKSRKEFEEYFLLRWKYLRKPLGFELGSEQDEVENSAFHIAAFHDGKIIGVGRLQTMDDSTARVRYMAVSGNYRTQGIGSRILLELEKLALNNNVQNCWLYARETAAIFYQKNNYKEIGTADSDLEIKHLRMEKTL